MSLLVELFMERGSGEGRPEDEIIRCIKQLRKNTHVRACRVCMMERFFDRRQIKGVTKDKTLKADGALVPLGKSFGDGFSIVLRPDIPETRINFTVAHEICHTFFYERVPEIKLELHMPDPDEERLCNLGAEELLMPAQDVKRRAKGQPASLLALGHLATYYNVSVEAMFVRLRRLRIWDAELSVWRQMTNGDFAVRRLWGGKVRCSRCYNVLASLARICHVCGAELSGLCAGLGWKWIDETIPCKALTAGHNTILSGQSFWILPTDRGPRFRPISYEIRRHRDGVLALIVRKRFSAPEIAATPEQELFYKA